MTFTICFDFPEIDDPLFAGWCGNGTLGYAPTLQSAASWDSEWVAQQFLDSYGPSSRKFGAVVEVGQ